MAFVSAYSFMEGKNFGLEFLAAPVPANKPYQSLIIVHRDGVITSFKELRGKSFSFTDLHCTTGRIYPLTLLTEMGQTPEAFFKSHIFTYGSDNSERSVSDRLVDGAAVDSVVYGYMVRSEPKAFRDLVIIDKSPELPVNPVVVTAGLDGTLKEKLSGTFLTLHENEKGQEILSKVDLERYEYDSSLFECLKNL